MALTRQKSKGRRGAETERFAYLPESVMEHPALATAPHAAFRVLAILVLGKPKERNGTLACTDSYAERFGMHSKDTRHRALQTLAERGLIVCTRQGFKMRKVPTLWAVTWWPVYYREGQPLATPEPASHAYRSWTDCALAIGVNSQGDSAELHPEHRGSVTPAIGVEVGSFHPDLPPKGGQFHPDHRGYSKNLGVVGGRVRGLPSVPHSDPDLDGRILKLMRAQLHLLDSDIAKIMKADQMRVAALRQSMGEMPEVAR